VNDQSGHSAAIDDPRVAAAMQQYLESLEAGRSPSRQEFLAQHAEIAAELGGCLDGLELVHEAAQSIRQADHAETILTADELKQPLGDYKIVREIGRGGMGIVYEATQLSLGRRVALKILPLAAALDPKYLQRFKNEAQAAAQLHHTNIVPVYAVGSERGVHYYAMQLIDGYSLADLIEQRRQFLGKSASLILESDENRPTERVPVARRAALTPVKYNDPTRPLAPRAAGAPQQTAIPGSTRKTASERNAAAYFRTVAGLIRQAALALEHAHQLGVIHRDIKPANLLLDERGNLWVTDFGLAHFQANMQLTRTGDMLGTLRYMSPEQTSGDRVVLDHRADIYSLGVTLYELLTLEPVIRGDEPHSVLRRIVEEEPTLPRAHDKNIPRELETIVLKAIAKLPGDRYATAAELADDLQRWLDDQPIKARRPTLAEHAARWSRRHWALVTAAACMLGVAALGLLISTIIIANEHSNTLAAYKVESQQRAVADRQRQLADEQRQAADESFRQARRAVDTFLTLSEEELAARPTLAELRRKFLETALEYYNNFLDQRRDDPAVGEELLTTSVWVKQIVEELAALERLAAFGLLANPFVQQEIGLSDMQREGLGDIAEPDGGGRRGGNFDSFALTDGSRLSEQAKEASRVVDAVLTPKQISRLHQIGLQQRGPLAFKRPDVVKALALTAEQRTKISGILEEESPERRLGGRRRGMPPPRDELLGGGLPPPDFGGDRFGGPPPRPDGERGPPGKKGGPPGGPRDKNGKGGPPPDEFRDFGGRGPGGPPPGERFGDGRGGPPPPPPDGRGGKGPMDFGGPGGRPPPPHEELRLAADRAIRRIVDLLTVEQKTKWQELVGEPFDHDLPPPRN
jgi:serine/threonine protein kinase